MLERLNRSQIDDCIIRINSKIAGANKQITLRHMDGVYHLYMKDTKSSFGESRVTSGTLREIYQFLLGMLIVLN